MTKLILIIFSLVLLSTLVTADGNSSDEEAQERRVLELLGRTKADISQIRNNEYRLYNLRMDYERLLANLAELDEKIRNGFEKHNLTFKEIDIPIKDHEERLDRLRIHLAVYPGMGRRVLDQPFIVITKRPTPPPPKPPCLAQIGFIYFQRLRTKAPAEMWPETEWKDVSSEYGGSFFRVVGNYSKPFGENQEDQARQFTKAKYMFFERDDVPCTADFASKGWTEHIKTGLYDKNKYNSNTAVRFFTDDIEVRPRNSAVRVWIRVK